MKKIAILFFILFFASACGNSEIETTDYSKNTGIDIDLGDMQTETSKLLETEKADATEDEAATKDSEAEETEVDLTKIDPNQFKDLVNKYDSAVIETNYGDITIKFYNADSPFTVNNFMNLADNGFYDNTKFHRIIEGFMIQAGDPNSKDDDWTDDGRGGPAYRFNDEFNNHKIVRGSLAMANAGPDTNGSQFFIVTAEATPNLDGKHTNFGYVIDGMDVVDEIEAAKINENSHPLKDVVIESIILK